MRQTYAHSGKNVECRYTKGRESIRTAKHDKMKSINI